MKAASDCHDQKIQEKTLMNENEKMELRDEELEQVSGGAINVYDAGAYHTEY